MLETAVSCWLSLFPTPEEALTQNSDLGCSSLLLLTQRKVFETPSPPSDKAAGKFHVYLILLEEIPMM